MYVNENVICNKKKIKLRNKIFDKELSSFKKQKINNLKQGSLTHTNSHTPLLDNY